MFESTEVANDPLAVLEVRDSVLAGEVEPAAELTGAVGKVSRG